MAELNKSKNTILFIDEMHLLVGAGAAEGAIDAGNILKPVLARGSLQVIGATTTAEYTKHVEKDAGPRAAFSSRSWCRRRPSRRRRPSCAASASATPTTTRLRFPTISWSGRFPWPTATSPTASCRTKAIDLLDEAAAHLRVTHVKTDPAERLREKKIQRLRLKMKLAVEDEDYEKAAELKKELALLTVRPRKQVGRQDRPPQARPRASGPRRFRLDGHPRPAGY